MSVELSPTIRKIESLRLRTVERGASEAEQDTSAMILGHLLQRTPSLKIIDGEPPRAKPHQSDPRSRNVTLHGVSVEGSTDKAILFYVPLIQREIWIPRSQILHRTEDDITIPRWLWTQKEAE